MDRFHKGASGQSLGRPPPFRGIPRHAFCPAQTSLSSRGDAFGIAAKGAQKLNDIVGTSSEKETLIKAQTALRWNPAWHMDSFYSIPMARSLNQAVTSSAQKAGELVQKAGEEFLVKGMDQFDERLRVLTDIEPRAKEVWSQIQDPINLEKGIWFLLQPKSMSVGEVRIDPRHPETVRTVFQMKAQPEILFGPKPGALKSPLPPLSKFEKGPVGFHAVSNLLITYPEAIQLIQDLHMGILGHVFKETGDRKLRITGMRFYGSGGSGRGSEAGIRPDHQSFGSTSQDDRLSCGQSQIFP